MMDYSKQYKDWPKFNGHPVNPKIMPLLNLLPLEVIKFCKMYCTQAAGSAKASGKTHLSGHCLDFVTYTWTPPWIRMVDEAFKTIGAAPVLRLIGDDLGIGKPNITEHMHVAFKGGTSNYRAVNALIGPGGRNYIEKKLAQRAKHP